MGIMPLKSRQPQIYQRDFCMVCKGKISTKITREYHSELCACGMWIRYPPKRERPYATRTFIKKEEYDKEKIMKAQRKKLLKEMDAKGIDIKVANKSKLHRTLTTVNKNIPDVEGK